LVVVVVGAVVGVVADDELDDDEPDVVGVVVVAEVPDAAEPAETLVGEAEWAVVSAATKMPNPTAAAVAAMVMAAVSLRTRDMALSRSQAAGWPVRWFWRGWWAMSSPFGIRWGWRSGRRTPSLVLSFDRTV
jgi:hypothetical protein